MLVFIIFRQARAQEAPNPGSAQSIYDFKVKTMKGEDKSLADYKGQVLLIVNTASHCGFTPQYAGLEKIYSKPRLEAASRRAELQEPPARHPGLRVQPEHRS